MNETLFVPVKQAEVALHESFHYIKRKRQRKFDSSILGKVVPRLCNMKVGQLAKFSDGNVAVIVRRLSSTQARLITGYYVGQNITMRERLLSNYTTMSVRMSQAA
jgi:hypothetical protein